MSEDPKKLRQAVLNFKVSKLLSVKKSARAGEEDAGRQDNSTSDEKILSVKRRCLEQDLTYHKMASTKKVSSGVNISTADADDNFPQSSKSPSSADADNNFPQSLKSPSSANADANFPQSSKSPSSADADANFPQSSKSPSSADADNNFPQSLKSPSSADADANFPQSSKSPSSADADNNFPQSLKSPSSADADANFPQSSKSPSSADADNNFPQSLKSPSSADADNNFPQSSKSPSSADADDSCPDNLQAENSTLESVTDEATLESFDSQSHENSCDEKILTDESNGPVLQASPEFQFEDEPGVSIEDLNRAPFCTVPEAENRGSVHVMMYQNLCTGGNISRWDSYHVKMPFCIRNECVVNGKIVNRWKLIEVTLLNESIRNIRDLERAILIYNPRYKDKWNFHILRDHFSNMSKEENDYFFGSLLRKMIHLALQLPNLCPEPIPLLQKEMNMKISFKQDQLASLLANAFFCTFPRRNAWKKTSEYVDYPDINFVNLYQDERRTEVKFQKLKCILHYFKRVTNHMPTGVVTFERRCLKEFSLRWFFNSYLTRLCVTDRGTIEDNGSGFLEVDFANKKIGGGVIGRGCVQEEIRFLICPELIVARLFTQSLNDNECLIMKGFERFSNYEGYADSFLWKGDCIDRALRYEGNIVTELVAIDALKVGYVQQFDRLKVNRELKKAYCGFYSTVPASHSPAICTGNWGCGAFGGDKRLKALIQFMAAAMAKRDLCYITFNDKSLKTELLQMHQFLTRKLATIRDIMFYIDSFNMYLNDNSKEMMKTNIFEYIYENFR